MGQVRRISGKIWRKSGRILLSMCWDLGGAWLHLPPSPSEGNPLYRKHPYNQPHSSSYSMPTSSCSSLEYSATMAVAAETRFHVLAVDDSLLDRLLIERLLKTSSYQVTTVDSGSKALQILGLQDDQTNSPSVSSDQHDLEVNLIITDYCMPEMTGYDLLKKIKESSSLRDIPVVIMSSENVPSRINRCLEEGAEEFFLKPVQLSDMNRLKPHILKGKYREEHEQQVLLNNSTTSSNNSSNKRKAMDDEISLEMTRPRLTSSLTVL